MQTEDEHIIHKCLNGEPEAFGFLVDKYKESVYAFAYTKLRNFHDAEDITQEVFIKAYRKLNTLRRWDSFLAWIYAITSNLCKNLLRDRSKKPDREFMEDKNPKLWEYHSINSYHENLDMQSIDDQINEALDSLPEIYSQVIVLNYLGDMNSFEIARFLGVSPTSIRERLSRARVMLRREMLAMMGKTFEEGRLKAGFTFRIVEMVKNIKVQPLTPNTLPWGLSVSLGIVALVLGISAHLNITDSEIYMPISQSAGESKVLNIGEFPVDIMKASDISVIANANSNSNGSGNIESSPQNSLFMAPQAEGGTWTKKTDMLTPRAWFATGVVNGKIYAFGGNDDHWNPGKILSATEEYDPLTDKWIKKADMLTPKYALSACEANGKIYAVGGMSQAGPNDIFFSTVEEYDPTTDKWTKKADMPTARATSVSSMNGKIYAIGGHNSDNEDLSIVEEYDPETDTWVRKADMLIPRRDLSTSAVNGKIYAINGFSPNHGDSLVAVEEYDPELDKWTRKANMPTARFSVSTCVANGKIYAIGGWSNDVENTVQEYDPELDKWAERAGMPTARYGLSASEVNGRIYVIGGRASMEGWNIVSTVEEYDPQGESKSIDFKGKLPTTWGDIRVVSSK